MQILFFLYVVNCEQRNQEPEEGTKKRTESKTISNRLHICMHIQHLDLHGHK